MNSMTSISATKISAFLNNIDTYGISTDQVISCANVNPFVLSSPDNRLSGDEAQKIIETAARLTQDDDLGLHQGEHLSKGFSNILGYILMNCSTLEECWTKYCKYEKIIDSTSISNFHIIDKNAVFSNITIDKSLKSNRHFSDFKIVGILAYIRLLSNKNIQLHEVHFTYPKPQDTSEYERIFQSKVYFHQSANALIFDSDLLNTSVVEPNRNLLLMFENNAQETLETLNNNNIYTNKVNEILLKEIQRGSCPSIETVAQKLFLSVRNLQLYLHEENTSYIKLLKKVRNELAQKYLKDRNISIDEIAYILGFSETSAFHRAFKSWTGLTPLQFKNGNLNINKKI